MNQLDSMRIFSKVAECLNFADAARQLGISNAVVTRSVATLEKHLRIRLINRTTRRVALTTAGQAYFEGCQDLLRQLTAMEQRILSTTAHPVGCLRIGSPASFSQGKLAAILTAFRTEHPHVSFDVTEYETINEIAPENYDLCFTAEQRLRDSSMVCRPLVRMHDVVVAAPAYIARLGQPATPAALTEHDILLASEAPNRYWEFRDFNGTHRVPFDPILTTRSLLAVKSAAVTGLGIARIANVLVERELAEGSLVTLLRDFRLDSNERTVWMLYSGQPFITQAVRAFIDFVVDRHRDEDAVLTRPTRSTCTALSSNGVSVQQ
jgi:DNA-binding transcriptional LysR family regulator